MYSVQECYSYMILFSLPQQSSQVKTVVHHGGEVKEASHIHPHSGSRGRWMHCSSPFFPSLFSLKFQAMECWYLHLRQSSKDNQPNLDNLSQPCLVGCQLRHSRSGQVDIIASHSKGSDPHCTLRNHHLSVRTIT